MEHKKITPLFFFLSLGTVVALIVSVSAMLNLSFETLNHALPDVLTDTFQYGYASYSYDSVRSALALLIILFPVYLILEWVWFRQANDKAISHWNTVVRKWAIYLILFLASVMILTDLVVLVRYFVSGEITTRFLLKVCITLLVAGKVGYYYVRVLLEKAYPMWRKIYLGGWILLALASIVWSFSVIGSPMNQRKLRLDDRRINDLQSIQWQVISYWQQKQTLPQTLAELSNPISSYMVPMDPEFEKGKSYEYSISIPSNVRLTEEGVRNIKTFELCATFDLPMPKGWVPSNSGAAYPMMATRDAAVTSMSYPGGAGSDSWDHESGHTCFTRTIDPDLYPPYPKPLR